MYHQGIDFGASEVLYISFGILCGLNSILFLPFKNLARYKISTGTKLDVTVTLFTAMPPVFIGAYLHLNISNLLSFVVAAVVTASLLWGSNRGS